MRGVHTCWFIGHRYSRTHRSLARDMALEVLLGSVFRVETVREERREEKKRKRKEKREVPRRTRVTGARFRDPPRITCLGVGLTAASQFLKRPQIKPRPATHTSPFLPSLCLPRRAALISSLACLDIASNQSFSHPISPTSYRAPNNHMSAGSRSCSAMASNLPASPGRHPGLSRPAHAAALVAPGSRLLETFAPPRPPAGDLSPLHSDTPQAVAAKHPWTSRPFLNAACPVAVGSLSCPTLSFRSTSQSLRACSFRVAHSPYRGIPINYTFPSHRSFGGPENVYSKRPREFARISHICKVNPGAFDALSVCFKHIAPWAIHTHRPFSPNRISYVEQIEPP